MVIKRRKTRVVKVGNLKIGGNNPVSVQSMTKTKTHDIKKTVLEIRRLEKAGCELVRVAVPDMAAAGCIREIKKRITVPIVADIHFNYKLAIAAISSGADKIRLNPGNIYERKQLIKVLNIAKEKNIAIRIGTNAGSVKRKSQSIVDSLVGGVLEQVRFFERHKFYNIVISVKASDVITTITAYRKIAKSCDYPLHLGVTASGTLFSGGIKSAIGIGALLVEGIGDTIRVSLNTRPEEEIVTGREILSSLRVRCFGPEIIACPTCGRCEVDLIKVVQKFEQKLKALPWKTKLAGIKVAIMGCVVNGPQEARDADFGVACGRNCGIIFKKGKILKKVKENKLVYSLFQEIKDAFV
ncbi:MAG: flavodoxin-dependent (E)-4-hydroxy-3-methylbut-2-enyl-diphosphate synthase [Candidatus Omnitrophota bacterium]